ncbi:hypothetical protein NQ314_008926 [Rhamnusium bicolor]|uniref:Uncharacterized protein n=1 Tax=Rhamnusium bicolor TaxID=1586634 RepID=A0AAV8Y5P7_9CUCU|nr:hypothetical protein NQ314_008926 [Rhamnusium bicolor]
MYKVLENRAQQDEERMDQLTNQLKEAHPLAEDADTNLMKLLSRKLAFIEDELEVAKYRVKGGDAKIKELEEELKVVGNFLKSLEWDFVHFSPTLNGQSAPANFQRIEILSVPIFGFCFIPEISNK